MKKTIVFDFDGTVVDHDLLTDMKKAGYQIAIFTGKGRRSLDISLYQLGLNSLFDILITLISRGVKSFSRMISHSLPPIDYIWLDLV